MATKLYIKGSKVNEKILLLLAKLKLSDCFTAILLRVVNVPDMAPNQSIPIEINLLLFHDESLARKLSEIALIIERYIFSCIYFHIHLNTVILTLFSYNS